MKMYLKILSFIRFQEVAFTSAVIFNSGLWKDVDYVMQRLANMLPINIYKSPGGLNSVSVCRKEM